MKRSQRKAAADLLRAAVERSVEILEGGASFLDSTGHPGSAKVLRDAAARVAREGKSVRRNAARPRSVRDEQELILFHTKQNIELVASLVDAFDIMSQAAAILYEVDALDLAERADVAAEYLHEQVEFAYSEINAEDFTGYHEGTNVESEFARLYVEFTTSGHLDPNDLPNALRGVLVEGRYDESVVRNIPDEELLSDARACRAMVVARGRG